MIDTSATERRGGLLNYDYQLTGNANTAGLADCLEHYPSYGQVQVFFPVTNKARESPKSPYTGLSVWWTVKAHRSNQRMPLVFKLPYPSLTMDDNADNAGRAKRIKFNLINNDDTPDYPSNDSWALPGLRWLTCITYPSSPT
ncbi:hypothetical protein J6590_059265 [Homalodisca vitripennis]|nr:hypothetical protein J6590_059265 [Homalodisca vitripennis]